MKKNLSCLLAVILALGFFCLLSFFDSTPEAQALSAPSSHLYVAKNESAGLYGDVILIPDSSSYTLYLPGSADPTKLCFSWGNDVTVFDQNGIQQVSGQAPVALSAGSVSYSVHSGSKEFAVRIQQGSRDVRAMFLEVSEGLAGFDSFENMYNDTSKETKAAGTMAFGSDTGYYFSIKGRGNSTWRYSDGKKPYNITLYKDGTYAKKQSTELIDGISAKSWSLLANEGDQSLLRNKLGYDLASALGIGLRSDFVDLYADGKYLGCYLMTPKNDYQAPDEGFVLEIDNYIDNEDPQFGLTGFNDYHPSLEGYQNRFTVKENNTTAATADIQSYMQQVWNALLDEDSDEYLQYIDLDSWAKFYLLHEFYKSFDVVCGSIFMHRDGTASTDKLIAGPIWDLDNSMGRTTYNRELGNNEGVGISQNDQHNPEGWYIQSVSDPQGRVPAFWLQQLGKHESFLNRVYQLYRENEVLFQSAPSMLDQSSDRLKGSAYMNFDLHGFAGSGLSQSCDNLCGCRATQNWDDCVYNLRNYAVKRAAFLSNNVPSYLTGNLTVTGVAQAGTTLTANVTGSNAANLVYTWTISSGNTPVRTATGKTLTLRSGEYGKKITCAVTSPSLNGSLSLTLNPVTVTFNYGGGSGSPTSVKLYFTLNYGQLPVPSKTGYSFTGWFTGANGTGTKVTSATLVTSTFSHTLYAGWQTVSAPTQTTSTTPSSSSGTTASTTTVPGTIPTVPTTAVPDTTVPGSVPTVPATTVPETSVSVPTVPATTVPGTIPVVPTVPTVPGANTTVPPTAAPTVPEATVPGTDVPTTPAPGTTVPGTAPSGTEAPQPSSPTHPQDDTQSPAGLIVGIVAVLLLAAGCGVFLFLKKRKQ